jgi:hypothetical protein
VGVNLVSLILREKHRLRVFVDTALRILFGPKGDEICNNRLEKIA